jgi:hypothetical protein
LRVHLRNVHGEDISSFEATIAPVTASTKVPAVSGAINEGNTGSASISKDSVLHIYLQLGSGKSGSGKVALEFCIPKLVEDDNSPPLQLAKPVEQPKNATAKAKP